jgi:hypothetical protein
MHPANTCVGDSPEEKDRRKEDVVSGGPLGHLTLGLLEVLRWRVFFSQQGSTIMDLHDCRAPENGNAARN